MTAPVVWHSVPTLTCWGRGMMVTDIEISPDSTMSIYVHQADLALAGPRVAEVLKLLAGTKE